MTIHPSLQKKVYFDQKGADAVVSWVKKYKRSFIDGYNILDMLIKVVLATRVRHTKIFFDIAAETEKKPSRQLFSSGSMGRKPHFDVGYPIS